MSVVTWPSARTFADTTRSPFVIIDRVRNRTREINHRSRKRQVSNVASIVTASCWLPERESEGGEREGERERGREKERERTREREREGDTETETEATIAGIIRCVSYCLAHNDLV